MRDKLGGDVVKFKGKVEPRPKTVVKPRWLDTNKHGAPTRSYRNAREAIKALGITCCHETFRDRKLVGGEEIGRWAGELSDAVTAIVRQIIVERFNFDPGKDNTNDAATELCLENPFDPIVDYLAGLQWDGKPRLQTWLTKYLSADDTPLHRAIGELVLAAAVRRARMPGCKFDHIMVLEGKEGTEKSTALVVLAGDENFSDQTILDAEDKQQQELVSGVWIFEIADLAGMKRSEVEHVKAFASRTTDRARPAYGRHRVDAPRRCIFIATTNDDQYLKSETGNRRFWPVKTGAIDIEALRRDRDQIWAEAAAFEATHDGPLILPKRLWAQAGEAQDERRQHDPWDDILSTAKGLPYPATDGSGMQEWMRSKEVLGHLNISADRATPEMCKRAARVMRRLGWTDDRRYFDGKQERAYWRPIKGEE